MEKEIVDNVNLEIVDVSDNIFQKTVVLYNNRSYKVEFNQAVEAIYSSRFPTIPLLNYSPTFNNIINPYWETIIIPNNILREAKELTLLTPVQKNHDNPIPFVGLQKIVTENEILYNPLLSNCLDYFYKPHIYYAIRSAKNKKTQDNLLEKKAIKEREFLAQFIDSLTNVKSNNNLKSGEIKYPPLTEDEIQKLIEKGPYIVDKECDFFYISTRELGFWIDNNYEPEILNINVAYQRRGRGPYKIKSQSLTPKRRPKKVDTPKKSPKTEEINNTKEIKENEEINRNEEKKENEETENNLNENETEESSSDDDDYYNETYKTPIKSAPSIENKKIGKLQLVENLKLFQDQIYNSIHNTTILGSEKDGDGDVKMGDSDDDDDDDDEDYEDEENEENEEDSNDSDNGHSDQMYNRSWSSEEISALNKFCSVVSVKDLNYWEKVSTLMDDFNRTAEECQMQYNSRFKTPVKKPKAAKKKKEMSPISFDKSKLRTLKGKRKLREITEEYVHKPKDTDIYQTTPFKNQQKSVLIGNISDVKSIEDEIDSIFNSAVKAKSKQYQSPQASSKDNIVGKMMTDDGTEDRMVSKQHWDGYIQKISKMLNNEKKKSARLQNITGNTNNTTTSKTTKPSNTIYDKEQIKKTAALVGKISTKIKNAYENKENPNDESVDDYYSDQDESLELTGGV
ncbi:myb domain-containing protein [Tieghemostelium lacteum]|uniref:Myb domain-containing protein n=1 Tax=Tieghemostelium lacteum TaxID=361077 RepID=A0A151ZEQ2_TIELA|nr:myb domain-containing protein [Tieghemostelium lacteum]|eukprot:KYQ92433.1 myb domain-containing protein [Tieghemostelium lacteum]